jgi:hypothetical protein
MTKRIEEIVDINEELRKANTRRKEIKIENGIINKRNEIKMDEKKTRSIYTRRITCSNRLDDIKDLFPLIKLEMAKRK